MPRLSSPGTLRSRLAAGAVALAILAVTLLGAVAQVATPVGTPAAVQAIGQLPPPWLEFGPEGQLQARIIVEGACPVLTLDGIDVVMDARGDPSPAFPVVACEATVPFGANVASISGQSLPLPKGPVERIAVIGDAGCRLNSWEKKYQDCNNPSAWPFAQVAASVASWQPDLIVHVGDFLYRESPCPAGMTGCAGSPYGDNWWAWQADFFTPASAMFPVAPFVIMRGNHETCDRNGDGWFAYLDPRPYPGACERFTDPYVTTLHGVTMAVIDSAEASDEKSSPEEDAEYARQFDELAVMAPPGSWLVTHRPVWGILAGNQGEFQVENAAS